LRTVSRRGGLSEKGGGGVAGRGAGIDGNRLLAPRGKKSGVFCHMGGPGDGPYGKKRRI